MSEEDLREAAREALSSVLDNDKAILALSQIVDMTLKEMYGESRHFLLTFEASRSEVGSTMAIAGNAPRAEIADNLRSMAAALEADEPKH